MTRAGMAICGSASLVEEEVFKEEDFSGVKTNIGIVATRWAFETPMIFKTSIDQAHGDASSVESLHPT